MISNLSDESLPGSGQMSDNGMVRPCSCPASDKLARGAKPRSTPCLRKTPAKPDPTDSERAELFKRLFAYSGTYKTEGNNKLGYNVDGSWNQSWTGTDLLRQVEITSTKLLTITTPPFESVVDGKEIVVTTTYERVE